MGVEDGKTMWIGELADRSGISADTIRYYERVGVLPEPDRTPGGFRVYGDSAVDRLDFVERARSLGLTLDEIAEIVGMVEEGVEPCEHVRDRLRQRLAEVEERIDELTGLRKRLKGALRSAEEAPPSGSCRCRIIERAGGETVVEIGGIGRGRDDG